MRSPWDAPTLEKTLHRAFLLAQLNKVNARKEFFRVAIADIKREVASWTLTAACHEWRESQAIELKLARDAGESQRWMESQIREHDRVVKQELVAEEEVA